MCTSRTWKRFSRCLGGTSRAHFHAHRADDILTAVRLAREFDLRYSILHATDASRIVSLLAREQMIPIVGPSMGPAASRRRVGGSFATAGLLRRAGMQAGHHDRPRRNAAVAAAGVCGHVRAGRACARRGAARHHPVRRARHGRGRAGRFHPAGKDADLVVFSGDPFHYLTRATAVFIDGRRVE